MRPIFVIRYMSVLAIGLLAAWLAPWNIWLSGLVGLAAAITYDNIFVRIYNIYRRRSRDAH